MVAQEALSVLCSKSKMKFDTLPDERGPHVQLVIIGLIILAALGVAIGTFIWLLHFRYFRLAIVFSPAIVVASWLTGHLIDRLDSNPKMCKCLASYNYFFTEWWHKRKCLAYTLNGND